MDFKIAIIPGDGIGPDIVSQAVNVLNKVGSLYNHNFNYSYVLAGGAAIDATGKPLPQKTIDICLASDSVLLGAVGGAKWDVLPGELRPEKALLGLRKEMGVFANLRPVSIFPQLIDASPLKREIISNGLDILIVRELTGGIYFGERGILPEIDGAFDTEMYTRAEIDRVCRVGFESAMKRGKKLHLVDKANVLESSRLWRKVFVDVAKDYPEVQLEYMYVDNAAMQLIKNPSQFDVIVTSNLFGDILSDEASQITGSIGMLPSASLGDSKCGLYEPIHGSAPDIAGKDLANPLATILSVALMLRYSLNLEKEASAIETTVNTVLDKGYRTGDIMSNGCTKVGTAKMGELVIAELIF